MDQDLTVEQLEAEVQNPTPSAPVATFAAKYPFGVVYKAPWETENDGVAIAARRGACALRRTGIPVFLQSESHMFTKDGIVRRVVYSELAESVLNEVDHITDIQHGQTVLMIRHVVPTKNKLESILYPREVCAESADFRTAYRRTLILYAAFEHNVVDRETVKLLNMFGRIWVPCTDNKRWLETSGVDCARIDVIPHPMAFRDPMRSTKRVVGPRPYRFLNVSKWEPRKAQHDLIGGFLIAFEPEDEVQLVMKCTPFTKLPGYPESPAESVKRWLEDPRVIANGWTAENIGRSVEIMWPKREEVLPGMYAPRMANCSLSRQQLATMYSLCDCYVSAGRSEGFDLPAFDSKVVGLSLISPLFGGPRDFLTDSDVFVSPTPECITYVPEEFYLPPKEARWSNHNAQELSQAMRKAYWQRNEPQVAFPTSDYTIDAVGRRMRDSLNNLARELGFDLSVINVDQ